MEHISLRHASGDAAATISVHGAQTLSWRTQGRERLFLSPNADFQLGSAIRGGVPVIFPQFGERGPGLRHGFARLLAWDILISAEVQPSRALCDARS